MKINMISTYPPERCGIADYSRDYTRELQGQVSIKPVRLHPSLNPLYYLWLAIESSYGADLAHVQYESSFFGTLKLKMWFSGLYTGLFYRALSSIVPVVSTVHEVQDSRKYAGIIRGLHYYYYSHVYRAVLSRSRQVYVHSFRALETLSQYADVSRVKLVPYPAFSYARPIDTDKAKTLLGLQGKHVLLLFGYLDSGKGHITAFEALRGLPDDVVLYVAGGEREPGYTDVLRVAAVRLGVAHRVVFGGFVDDDRIDTVFSAADMILLPYDNSMQSSVLHLALPYGKPIVASDVGGFHEIADRYGAILTFPKGDSIKLYREIGALLYDENYGHVVTDRASRYYQQVKPSAVVQRFVKEYSELAEALT